MRIYGIAEIAEALGVRRQTVAQWGVRGKLPEPDARLSMGPVWLAKTIRPWIRRQKQRASAMGSGSREHPLL